MTAFVPQSVQTGYIFDGPSEVYINGVFIGATTGGVEFSLNTEYGEKTADQTPLLLGSYIKQQRGMLKFEMEELTLANLKLAFATVASTAGGGNKSIIAQCTATFVGHGPNDGTRTISIGKARLKGNTNTKYELGTTVAYGVELLMEADQTQADGNQYFTVADT